MTSDAKVPASVSFFLANSKMISDPKFPSSSVSSKGKEMVQRKGRLLLSLVQACKIFLGGEGVFSTNSVIGTFLLFSMLPVHRGRLSEPQSSPW